MSQENVDVCRRALEAFMRRDNEAVLTLYDPDIEIHGHLDGGVHRGLDGVREFFRDWLSVWDGFSTEVEEWLDAGDHVVALVRDSATGKQSGVAVEQRQAHVWTLRGGRLWRLRIYDTKAHALEAVGLSG